MLPGGLTLGNVSCVAAQCVRRSWHPRISLRVKALGSDWPPLGAAYGTIGLQLALVSFQPTRARVELLSSTRAVTQPAVGSLRPLGLPRPVLLLHQPHMEARMRMMGATVRSRYGPHDA